MMMTRLISLLLVLSSLGGSTLERYINEMSLGGNLFLVNRAMTVSSDYEPEDLVKPDVRCTYTNITLRKEAAEALEQMFQAAKAEQDHDLIAVSGYRSYGQQAAIYERKIESVGKKRAALLVAPPGASEHQLGLAQDILSENFRLLNSGFLDTAEGKWLYENCQRFGFIVRYKKEWSDVTGYSAEPWHFRYIGVQHAMAVTELNIPYETYANQVRRLPDYVLTHGNACLLYHLVKDGLEGGTLISEMSGMPAEDQQMQAYNIVTMTEKVRPDHLSLQDAVRNGGVR